ncbi:hypothetical protein BpHYR1_018892 [Brachionus plicatilis]|uniref:Uncharacterized protein n=1 Tax=Brachionus plicatilis TaxID=10195 RepID=A0A3M7QR53_BRAPC|nr:hypothetical protein BpHYR1_018892 [Brachionus plicatilis]
MYSLTLIFEFTCIGHISELSELILRMEFLFIPICSCQEHELIINSRCELSAKCICQHFGASNF